MFIKLQVVGGNVTRFAVEGILTYWASHDGTNRIIARDCDVSAGEQYTIKETPEEIDALIEAEKRKELRDEFARNETLADVVDSCPHSECMDVLAGRPEPNGAVEFLQWEADWRAALKYIRADAMLRAREGK